MKCFIYKVILKNDDDEGNHSYCPKEDIQAFK